MFLNHVYKQPKSKISYRVIYESVDDVWLIDIEAKAAWPFKESIFIFKEMIETEEFKEIENPIFYGDVITGSKQELIRDEAYQFILPLLDNYVGLMDKVERNRRIREMVNSTGKARIYFVRQLRRYWQRGMSPNALLPDYHRSGAKGVDRRDVAVKPGRKRSRSEGVGVVINTDIAEIFSLAIEGFYFKNSKVTLIDAKDKAISMFKSRYPDSDKTAIPTLRQFQYFYKRNYKEKDVVKKRALKKIYDKDIRALTSTSTNLNIGPGGRYEIDATIADLYLVSEQDPERIIGRPVIYFVKDVFSRMVVGLYVGLENPSWVAAMMAMSNAFMDKVAYCKEYGIDITPSDWPSVGVPASIFADKGELFHRQADVLVNVFNIQLSNSRSYRGDDKGIVERHFRTLQAKFKPYIGGIVEPVNGKKRLGKRYELDAELTLHAFTEIVITITLHHNQNHVVSRYDFASDMPNDLPAIPLQLWNWGVKHRMGSLRIYKDDIVKVNLLPVEKGTISGLGIGFKGLYYTCDEAIKEGWFDRFKHSRPDKVDIAFDPRRTDIVYLRPDNSYENYWVCELSDRSRRFKKMSFMSAASFLKEAKSTEAQARQTEEFVSPDMQSRIEEIVAREKAKKNKNTTKSSAERLSGIRAYRTEERELERERKSVSLKKVAETNSKAKVIKINDTPDINLDYPSLDEYMENEDD